MDTAMQKSKSSSNVGQFVTRKILKSRSKSPSRPNTQALVSKWTPVVSRLIFFKIYVHNYYGRVQNIEENR